MSYTQKTILFFTAAQKPVAQELTDIGIMTDLGFNVKVRNGAAATANVQGGSIETADYAMDSNSGANIPAAYSGLAVASKTAPPAPPLLSTQKLLSSGVAFTAPATSGSRTTGWTPTVVAGAVTALVGS